MQSVEQKSEPNTFWRRNIPLLAGAFSILLGVVGMVGWRVHWSWAVRLTPELPAMHYNSALAFVLCGIALVLLKVSKPGPVPFLGMLVSFFGAITLVEYGLDWNLGIDQLFFRGNSDQASAYPARMHILTAVNFMCLGLALFMGALKGIRSRRYGWAGLLACIPASLSLVILLGYLFGVNTRQGWGNLTEMSLHSVVGFEVLGAGLLVWGWQQAAVEKLDFTRWIPLVSSVTLLVMIGVLSAVSLLQLNNAVFVRRGAYSVMRKSSSLSQSLANTQRGMLGYILTGAPAALETYQRGTNAVELACYSLEVEANRSLRQKRIVEHVITDAGKVVDYSIRLLATNQTAGVAGSIAMERKGEGVRGMNQAMRDLRTFSQDEEALLDKRDQTAGADFKNCWQLLGLSALLAGSLLALSSGLASREIRRRALAEEAADSLNQQLRATMTLQSAILESASYSVVVTDVNGVIRLFNATAERWLGYSAAEVVGKQTPAIWHDLEEVRARARDLSLELNRPIEPGFEVFVANAKLGQSDENEWIYVRKDGSRFPVLLSVTALKDGDGSITGFLGIFADITERRRSEEKLMNYLREMNEFRTALDEHAIVSLTDAHGKITYANDRFVAISKYSSEELIGKDHRLINSGFHGREFFKNMWDTIRQGRVWKGELRNRAKDGTYYWVESTIVPFMDAFGKPRQYVAMRTDVTDLKTVEEKLRQSEEQFRLVVENAHEYAMFMLDCEGRVASWNAGAARLKGYQAGEIIGQNFGRFFALEEIRSGKPESLLREALVVGRVHDEGIRMRKDGSFFYATTVMSAVRSAAGDLVGYSKVTRDITAQWHAAEALRMSEQRFRSAFGDAPIGMALVAPDGRWLRVNHALCTMVGYEESELLETDFQRITHPEDLQTDLTQVKHLLAGEIHDYQMEKRYLHKSGQAVPVMLSVSLVRNGDGQPLYFVSQVEDITERKRAAEKIADSLKEKEALLREIHHRVKNNMQVISSILQLQTGYIKDSSALETFKECQGRIRTMALIHEKLYRSEGLAQIDFKDYLESLVGLLLRSQGGKGVRLRHEFKVEQLTLDVDTAIPLGLIANELVSNCLKHAFTGRTQGMVRIGLTQINGSGFQMAIRDDGNGLPAGFDPDKTNSLGVRLVKILSGQIKCELAYRNQEGAEFTITNHGKNGKS